MPVEATSLFSSFARSINPLPRCLSHTTTPSTLCPQSPVLCSAPGTKALILKNNNNNNTTILVGVLADSSNSLDEDLPKHFAAIFSRREVLLLSQASFPPPEMPHFSLTRRLKSLWLPPL